MIPIKMLGRNMYKPSGLLFNKISVKPKTKVSKSFIVLFFTLHTFFGFSFGFTKHFNRTVQVLVKSLSIVAFLSWIYCLVYPIVIIWFVADDISYYTLMWYACNVFEYVTFFLILNLTKNNFYYFIKNISKNVKVIPELNKEALGIKASVYVFFIFFIRNVLSVFTCVVFHAPWCETVNAYDNIHDLSELSFDVVSLVLILITYYIHCYIKHFKHLVSQLGTDTQSLLQYYLKLTDSYDYIMPLYDRLAIALLVFEVPRMMMVVWFVLNFFMFGMNWFFYFNYALYAVYLTARLVLPCVITEMIQSQVQSARVALYHRMLQETETKKKEIQEILQYMSVRRLHHRAGRVIPLDMTLPLIVLNTCVTYLIVIIQFSHLY